MSKNRRIACIGDIHACCIELEELVRHLEWLSLDEIWATGDVIERGPDNAATIALLRQKGIKSVCGNHEKSILKLLDRKKKTGELPGNSEKRRAIEELTPSDIEYIEQMPLLHVFDDPGVILVHGGLFPGIDLYRQPENAVRAQLIHSDKGGECRWWGPDATHHKSGKSEEESRTEGYYRWYERYDFEYDCVYGHSVWQQPFIHQNPGSGRTIGVDLGSCFGGSLCAAIMDGGEPWFVVVKSKKIHFQLTRRLHQED